MDFEVSVFLVGVILLFNRISRTCRKEFLSVVLHNSKTSDHISMRSGLKGLRAEQEDEWTYVVDLRTRTALAIK